MNYEILLKTIYTNKSFNLLSMFTHIKMSIKFIIFMVLIIC